VYAHDKYLASKNVTRTVSPQTYLNHPFETRQNTNAPRRLVSTQWEPLRIHMDTSDLAKHYFEASGNKTLKRITSSILPLAIKVLSKHLHVIRVNGNLKITPVCLDEILGQPCCSYDERCHWAANTCADVAVPDSHKTVGIPDADFVIYLTANEGGDGQVLATGVTCKVDQHDRPLAGQVKINLKSFTGDLPTNYLVSAFTHEISHALGWTHDSFIKFRDENGDIRSNVITTKSALGKTISLLSTPAITKYVRSYFGCDSLAGMELEDQGGPGTASSHPERRIFPESYMSGATEADLSNYIIDGMALTVFQDSGWYQVKNLDQAGRLSFGRGMGCRVPTHKCNDWGAEANARGMFCSQQNQTFCSGNNKHVLGYCGLAQYSGELPSMFQYFSDPTSGGRIQIADFCPRVSQYSNGDCTDPDNTDGEYAGSGNQVGTHARCFMSSLSARRWWHRGPSLRTPQAQCFRRSCTADALQIHVGSRTVACPVSNHATSAFVDGYMGYMVCPPYSGLADIRCSPRCSTNDPECLGPKGSAANFTGSIDPAAGGTVVVHGRKLLRH